MNKRIKELAKQAWQYANNNSRDGDDTHGWLYRDKFAELLVRECAMFVVTELEGKVGSLIADATANRLEEHFGIKE